MTLKYKKSVLNLLRMLHEARMEPFDNIEKWLVLQEAIIKKLSYVEGRIRHCRASINSINIKRKNSAIRLTKQESNAAKEEIKLLKYKIEEYQWIILILKSIGDGIAFTFIHKLDIKPQNFKESPGFISGKAGLILEKKILRLSFKNGLIAILNDITSVLKYFDLTIVTENGYIPVEAKSSKMNNSRIDRQSEKTDKLLRYLSEVVVNGLYNDNDEIMQRVAIRSPEINYIGKFNELVYTAQQKGFDYTKFEEGFICLVAFENINNDAFDLAFKGQGLSKPFAFHLNMYKFEEQGYYPFSLIYSEPTHYWDFLEGRLNVFTLIDFTIIEKVSFDNGYSVEQAEEADWAFTFKSLNPESGIQTFNMSEHFFHRTIMEFVSIRWLLEDTFNRLKNRTNEIKDYNIIKRRQ